MQSGATAATVDPSISESSLGEVGSGVAAGLEAYWFACASINDGGGILTNGSLGIVGQTVAGQMVSASYRIDVGAAPCMGASTDEPPPPPPAEGPDYVLWMTFTTPTVVPGLGTVGTEDIVSYDMGTQTWAMVFDGSDVGLSSSYVIDGMAREANGHILLSFTNLILLARYYVDDSDVMRFVPTSLGSTTAGSFSYMLDASDVGLSVDTEDVDAIDVAPDGRVVLSTNGAFVVSGVSGGGEDMLVFNAVTFGTATFGSFAMYFDGSDVELNTLEENLDAIARTEDGSYVFSTEGLFAVTGASGDDDDVVEFIPGALGASTSGNYRLLLELSSLGIDPAADIGALEAMRP
jgi:hypothetical protein